MKLLPSLLTFALALAPALSSGPQPREHYYTIDPNAGPAANTAGFTISRLTGFALNSNPPGTETMYSWTKASSKYLFHFYTTDPNGEKAPQAGFKLDGPAWFGPQGNQPGAVPLLRYISTVEGNDHLYTTNTSPGEINYRYEGIAGYVYADATRGGVPINEYVHAATS
ncbi:hypothetical protein MMC25_004038 [Agyrium rufum]|nr:hypothetical protein [Agyrium rufum]